MARDLLVGARALHELTMEQKQKRTYQSRHQSELGIVSALQLVPRPRARVTFPDRQNLQSWWLRVLQHNTKETKDFWMPDLGEQVECLMDENFRNGLILGASYSDVDQPPPGMTLDKRHTTFKDGATLEYDRALHVLTHLAQDGALFKYDAAAHVLSFALPSGATISIPIAGGGSIAYDSSGNWKIEPGVGKVLIADASGGTQPIARIGDTVTVPNIQSGSDTATGTIATGSSKASAGG
jgi:phage baseplate assembly protein gpV